MHKHHEAEVDVKVGIVSVSSSKRLKHGELRGINYIPQDDESARTAVEELNFDVVEYVLVGDDEAAISKAVLELSWDCNAIITIGGTGITPKDVTVEAIKPLVKKELEGFGEIFRYESYKEIGPHAMLSRAFAGIIKNGTAVFCLPGSKNAVKLGIRLINPVLKHVISHSLGLR